MVVSLYFGVEKAMFQMFKITHRQKTTGFSPFHLPAQPILSVLFFGPHPRGTRKNPGFHGPRWEEGAKACDQGMSLPAAPCQMGGIPLSC